LYKGLKVLALALPGWLAMLPGGAQAAAQTDIPYATIDDPQYVPAAGALFLQDDYLVLGLASRGVVKAYPIADIAQHGAVMETMPEGPVAITWCGVCNTGAVYRRTVKGRVLHFDYDSMVGGNEVDRDRETGSRWQQSLGEAIDGPLKGTRMGLYPFTYTTWGEWRRQHPDTLVLRPLPGYAERMPVLHRLARNSLVGDGEAPAQAFGKDWRLRPREVVAGLEIGDIAKAYPFSALRAVRVINDRLGGAPVLVVHQPASDTTTAFIARARGRVLHFDAADPQASELIDRETGSHWNAYGLCLAGALKGIQLERLILEPEFWFGWSEFRPHTLVYAASTGTAGAGVSAAVWEPLLNQPLPEDAAPKITVLKLHVRPAQSPQSPGAPAHTHAGPVFAYLLDGNIENQVEPGPLRSYSPGGFFHEAPGQVHRTLRNLSTREPADLLVFMAGDTGNPARPLDALRVEPIPVMAGQRLRLIRATLPARSQAMAPPHSGPGLVYVLEGRITTTLAGGDTQTHAAGELFPEPAHEGTVRYANPDASRPARVLVFSVNAGS
jgi:quercetin dioxygenase-like cupin family protein